MLELFTTLRRYVTVENIDLNNINCEVLLFGDDTYSFNVNRNILKAVHTFIEKTGILYSFKS